MCIGRWIPYHHQIEMPFPRIFLPFKRVGDNLTHMYALIEDEDGGVEEAKFNF